MEYKRVVVEMELEVPIKMTKQEIGETLHRIAEDAALEDITMDNLVVDGEALDIDSLF